VRKIVPAKAFGSVGIGVICLMRPLPRAVIPAQAGICFPITEEALSKNWDSRRAGMTNDLHILNDTATGVSLAIEIH
jgi:hypothetical protein